MDYDAYKDHSLAGWSNEVESYNNDWLNSFSEPSSYWEEL